mmetsp:Transcript_24470/g.63804  ORF Transcript_24470/g.63804 Transcript_24470/m.63804 type:complete len:103 (+) Transcript_24470:621-929(+)
MARGERLGSERVEIGSRSTPPRSRFGDCRTLGVRPGDATSEETHAMRVSGCNLFRRVRSYAPEAPTSRFGSPVKMLKSVSSLACGARGKEYMELDAVLSIDA